MAPSLASAILTPSRYISKTVAAALSLLPGHFVGIQARVGAISGDGTADRYPQSAALMRYVDCAYAHLPEVARAPGWPLSFFLASDSLEAKVCVCARSRSSNTPLAVPSGHQLPRTASITS